MTQTELFQRDVALKLSLLFSKKLRELEVADDRVYNQLKTEYIRQRENLRQQQIPNIKHEHTYFNNQMLTCLSEPITDYRLSDLTEIQEDEDRIYSPRVDIAITPAIMRKRNKMVSLGVFKLTEELFIFDLLHKLDIVLEIERSLRTISNRNLEDACLKTETDMPNIDFYLNKRPLHLFAIEIENQPNPKHLMGDFLNAISLSKIPIVLLPDDNYENCISMMKFSATIKNIKDIKIYDFLGNVIILSINQFKDAINSILQREGINELN